MSQSRICHNVIKVPDAAKFYAHVTPLNPRAMVVLNDVGLARTLKDKLPDCDVIYRFKGGQPGENDDGENLLQYTADEWLDMMSHKLNGDKRIILYAGNEMPLNAAVIEWLRKLVLRANERGWKLCVLNLATGNPGGQNIVESWAVAKPLLTLLALYRQHILGLHAYFGGVVTSGLYGGYPDNAGVQPGEPGGHNLIPRANWPADVRDITCYHLGRHKFLLQYCDTVNLPYPRIIITEYGADNTSDIKPWLETLKRTPGYLDIRGWRSLVEQWKIWYPGIDAEEVYADMLIYGDDAFFVDSPVEAECIFQMGNDTDWQGFNAWGAARFLARLVAHARATLTPQEQPVSTLPLPTDARWVKATNLSGADYRVRLTAQVNEQTELDWIRKGADFSYFAIPNETEYVYTKTAGGVIGVSHRDVLTVVAPPPPIVDEPEPPTTPIEPSPDLSIIFKQHREAWQMLIDNAKRDLEPLLVEQHAIANRIQKLRTQIGMYEQWKADIDVIESAIELAKAA